jgi:hypothetical protein
LLIHSSTAVIVFNTPGVQPEVTVFNTRCATVIVLNTPDVQPEVIVFNTPGVQPEDKQ